MAAKLPRTLIHETRKTPVPRLICFGEQVSLAGHADTLQPGRRLMTHTDAPRADSPRAVCSTKTARR